MKRPFRFPIHGNPLFPCPENEGGSTIPARVLPGHGRWLNGKGGQESGMCLHFDLP